MVNAYRFNTYIYIYMFVFSIKVVVAQLVVCMWFCYRGYEFEFLLYNLVLEKKNVQNDVIFIIYTWFYTD